MSKLETNTEGLNERNFQMDYFAFSVRIVTFKGRLSRWLQDSRNNKNLSHISIVDYISFDTDISSCGLESINLRCILLMN